MSQPPWPVEQNPAPPRGLGAGAGAGLGLLAGLLGPVVLGFLTGVAAEIVGEGSSVPVLIIGAFFVIPVILFASGIVLVIPDFLRGWGVACLVSSGIWLISSAGVCTFFFFGGFPSATGSIG